MFEFTPDIIQIWIASLLTVAIYTFPFKDNDLFKFAEHVYLGAAIAFGVVMAVQNIRSIAFVPLITKGEITWIIPIILGILLYARFSDKFHCVSRYPLSFIVALGTALSMRTIVSADFTNQIKSTLINPFITSGPSVVGSPQFALNNLLLIIIVICTLIFFIFSGGTTIQKNPIIKWINIAARYFMMVAFGAAFGNTVMTRVAFMIERIRYVVQPANRVFLPVIAIIVIIAMVPREWIRKT
jgi:hypothetical protein